MRLLVKLALAAGALWAVWSFVPVGGRTVEERWRTAPSAQAFALRGWSEIVARVRGGDPARRAPARPDPRAARPPARDARPAEGHTDSDRRAVDRLVADRLRE
jgi:hypothetical protein